MFLYKGGHAMKKVKKHRSTGNAAEKVSSK